MSLSIKYRDEIIATTVENETKTLLTRGKICDSDIEVTNVVDEPTIQSLSATENGVYNVPDGVDGFNPVTVNVPQALLQEKTLTLGASAPADVTPDTGYDGLSSVPVVLDTQVIKAENIAQGATILGVEGTHSGGGTDYADSIIDRTISGIYINNELKSIGRYAFYCCYYLNSVSFPACTTIGSNAFYSCVTLRVVSFPVCTHMDSNVFNKCDALQFASFPVCTSIGSSAFYGCSALRFASFPACSYICPSAFCSCISLQSVSFPSCASIGSSAFFGCASLQSVIFPVCTSIGSSAFAECSSLQLASFPSCKQIYNYAFLRCRSLLSLYLLGSSVVTLLYSTAFNSTPIAGYTSSTGGVYGSIIVPESLIESYKIATNWSHFSSRFSVWNGVE